MKSRLRQIAMLWALVHFPLPVTAQQRIQTPEEFFGFPIGADGELARYPKVLEYMQHLSRLSDRVDYQELGKTTLGNPYVLVTFSSADNLARMEQLVGINRRLADPRGLSPQEAQQLARQGRTFYFLYATIHSTEVGNGQAILEIAHRMATSQDAQVGEILENTVLLMVPSQNPDGQILVLDHWYQHKESGFNRVYPDLYHHYTGHDDNRDWFMFTQIETRLNVEKVQNAYRPQLTHDMHQMGNRGFRIFVPPFVDPYDPNIHPILSNAQAEVGLAMASALTAAGKEGVGFLQRYDLWTPARQYMVYHGQPRILTEIASVSLADPQVNPAGEDQPLGPQERRWNFPKPYSKGVWKLRDIVDYGQIAVFAGLSHLAKYRQNWLESFYVIHRDWVQYSGSPYAFVIPAVQRDPFEAFELMEILDIADVEIHRARGNFQAGGKSYAEGSWVVKLAQPYGAFAKTMLERQVYPDLRFYPGGPPIPPYDATGHTLGLLMGVDVHQIEAPFQADLELLQKVAPPQAPPVDSAQGAYLIGPESNAAFRAVAKLQEAGLTVYRSSQAFEAGGQGFGPGTWIIPASGQAQGILHSVSQQTGLIVSSSAAVPAVEGFAIKQPTRVGLWKSANSMPGGWLKWLLEQYGFQHKTVDSAHFEGDLSQHYDVLVLPSGTRRSTIVRGLSPDRHDESWRWAYGVGQQGWAKLRDWVLEGGTLVAIGSASETVRQLLDLPIEGVLPQRAQRFRGQAQDQSEEESGSLRQELQQAFQSPARLMKTLQDQVVEPTSLFFCPGSLLRNQFDTSHPIAYGMPPEWPVFFRFDQAYRLRPGFGSGAEVAARYPKEGPLLESGWLLGEEYLRDLANVMAFRVGKGKAVILASQVDFRTQTRATFKLLFNAIYQGPARPWDNRSPQQVSAPGL